MSTAKSLQGKTALVTGGAGGIGAACAAALLQDGAAVVLMGRREAALQAARAALLEKVPGGEVRLCPGDALREEDVCRAVDMAHAVAGRLDIVVPTVGGGGFKPLLLQDLDGLRRELDLNIGSVFLAVRHAAPVMARGGSIVCISSTTAGMPFPWLSAYCAGKAGLEGLVRAAADELSYLGLRINAVRPGLTRSEATGDLFASPEVMQAFEEQIPLRRPGEPEDIAASVRYLAGPESSWVTGQCFNVDGGQCLRRHPDMTGSLSYLFGDAQMAAVLGREPQD